MVVICIDDKDADNGDDDACHDGDGSDDSEDDEGGNYSHNDGDDN